MDKSKTQLQGIPNKPSEEEEIYYDYQIVQNYQNNSPNARIIQILKRNDQQLIKNGFQQSQKCTQINNELRKQEKNHKNQEIKVQVNLNHKKEVKDNSQITKIQKNIKKESQYQKNELTTLQKLKDVQPFEQQYTKMGFNKFRKFLYKHCLTSLKQRRKLYFDQKKYNLENYKQKLIYYHDILDEVIALKQKSKIISQIKKLIENVDTLQKIYIKKDWHGNRGNNNNLFTFLIDFFDSIEAMKINKKITIYVQHIGGRGDKRQYDPVVQPIIDSWIDYELKKYRASPRILIIQYYLGSTLIKHL